MTASPGVVWLVQVQIWLLFLVPAGLRFAPFGALGTPAVLWGFVLAVVWLVAIATPGGDGPTASALPRPCVPVRVALGLWWAVVLVSFVLMHRTAAAADEVSNADRFVLSLVAFSGLALLVAEGVRGSEQQRTVVRTAVAAVAVMSVIALLQARAGIDVREYVARLPGLSADGPLASDFSRSGIARPSGTATHPIEFGVVAGLGLALAVHVALYDRVWSARRRYAALGLVALGTPLALSRSALLVAAIVIVVVLVDLDVRRGLKALTVMAGFGVVMFMIFPGLLGTLSKSILRAGSDASITTRTSDYAAVAPYLRESPWWGRGPGTFLPRLRILDNQYLLTLIEVGVAGLVGLVVLLGLPAWLGSASRSLLIDEQDRHLGRMLMAIGLGALAASATFDALSFPMFTTFMALMIGLTGQHWLRALDERRVAAPLPSPLPGTVPSVVVPSVVVPSVVVPSTSPVGPPVGPA